MTDYLTSSELWKHNVGAKRNAILERFLILYQNGYELNPNGLEHVLISDYGWPPVSARQAAEIAERIRSGEDLKAMRNYLDSSILETWRSEAEAS